MNGLSNHEVESLRAQHGFNEVKTNQTPEWKKILWRYLDWVSIVILIAAIINATVEVQGGRGWTSFALLIVELNLIVWVGYYSERNAGNAVKELEVRGNVCLLRGRVQKGCRECSRGTCNETNCIATEKKDLIILIWAGGMSLCHLSKLFSPFLFDVVCPECHMSNL